MATLKNPSREGVHSQKGVTLVELLVTLVIAMVVSIAVLIMQGKLSQQNMQSVDIAQRDDQVRTALDMLTRELTSAGFLLDGLETPCASSVQYNSGVNPPVQGRYAIEASKQPSSLPTSSTLPTGIPDPAAYASVGGGNTSYMIIFSVANNALQVATPGTPPYYTVQNSIGSAAAGQGAVGGSVELPLNAVNGISAGDSLLVRLPYKKQILCFRVPVDSLSGNSVKTGSNALFPANGFSGFETFLKTQGILEATDSFSNSNFPRARVANMGPAATGHAQRIAYYIASISNGNGGNVPVLARAVLNASNDQIIGNPVVVAAGVINMQALFGIDATGSGGVTNYYNWENVIKNKMTKNIRSISLAFVTRTTQTTRNNDIAPTAINFISPKLNSTDDSFQSYNPGAAEERNRFAVVQTEIAIRNNIWAR